MNITENDDGIKELRIGNQHAAAKQPVEHGIIVMAEQGGVSRDGSGY